MRGTGTTTQQIKAAPLGALFITNTDYTDYPKNLAKRLGREDLIIKPFKSLRDWQSLISLEFTAVIVDHAAQGDEYDYIGFAKLISWAREDGADERRDLALSLSKHVSSLNTKM